MSQEVVSLECITYPLIITTKITSKKKKQDSKVPFAMIIFRITDSQHWVTGSISSVKLLSIPFRQSRKCMHSENIMKEWLKKPCFDIKH